MAFSLSQLNSMDQDAFTDALGAVFEATPTIAYQTWNFRPFNNMLHLHQTMVEVVRSLLQEEQLALIRAHPDLGSRAKMADASVHEQTSVGLNRLSPREYEEIQTLNQAYRVRFDFPFIIAVKNHTKASIVDAFYTRLTHDVDAEIEQALKEIEAITYFRLHDLIE